MLNKKIMVVDDSPFQISMLRDLLEDSGYDVVAEASNLQEVVENTKKFKPDLVTMDMTMPGTDGFQCTQAIKDIDQSIKVIIVSSMMDDELIKKAKNLKISGYIQKPVDEDELNLLLERIFADENLYDELKLSYGDVFKEAFMNIITRLTKATPLLEREEYKNEISKTVGIAGIIGITGKYSGRLIVDMSEETANNIAEKILKKKIESEEECINLMSEIINMYAGNACSMLNRREKLYGFRVAPPSVLQGNSINIAKSEIEDNLFMEFTTEYGNIRVNIGFKRSDIQWLTNI